MNRLRIFLAATSLSLATACASASGPASSGDTPPQGGADRASTDQIWPIKTREHVDLWLHGFALLQDDTATVPLFRRGYRDQLIVARNSANVSTLLDTNVERLRARFALNRTLVNAQFVPLYFASANELDQAISLFLQAEGQPQAASQREVASIIALLAGYFPSPADREWLRLFWESVRDESNRFYHSYWTARQAERASTLRAVDSLWQQVYRPRLQRFLANTQQGNGSLVLSLPLDGEGRTLSFGNSQTVAVTYPDRPADAAEAIYVAVHETVLAVASVAVTDHLTPAELREGLGDRYTLAAAVRGGAMLLQRLAPELADSYARYYLRAANKPIGGNVQTSLVTAFPLTEAIRDAITRQFDVVLGGI